MNFLFWLHNSEKKGYSTIYARITINGKRAEFSTGISIITKFWGGAKLITQKTQLAVEYNDRLRQIEADAHRVFNRLRDENKVITAAIVKEQLLNKKTVLSFEQLVEQYIASRFDQVGISCELATAKKHERYAKRIIEFAKTKKIQLPTDFNIQRAMELAAWLKNTQSYVNAYINKHFDCLRSIFRFSHRMQIAPFMMHGLKDLQEADPTIIYLEEDEVMRIERLEIEQFSKLDKVRDILIMCIETGLHYIDYSRLARNTSLEQDEDGDWWISLNRKKTDKPVDILLSEKAGKIIEKYGGIHALPAISNQKCNDYLKILALMAGIDKNLTTKVGRKTFCDTAINVKKARLDIVATALGLTSIRELKHYGNPRRALLKSELKKVV